MNVLLTHGYFLEEDEKEKLIMKPYVPLGILYISAWLEKHGVSNEVFDSTFSNKTAFFRHLDSKRPGIVGIYTNLMTKLNILKIINYIRQHHPATKIVLGGPEVRASAERFLRYGADIIVLGEGEETMLELVRSLQADPAADLSPIAGIAFLSGERYVQNAEREKISNIDLLPFPNRSAVDLKPYLATWKKHHGKSTISVSTMRGCPYSCRWCSRAVYGMSYRRRSARLVVEELKSIQNTYRPDLIWFVDDVFTINHRWLHEFSEALRSQGVSIAYECITRADRLNEDVIRTLKETGCFRVWIGAESGSQKIIDRMDRRVKVEQVREMIQLASRYGIETGTFIMLGYPGETETDIQETIRHLKISNPDHFTITIAYPIQGTELFNEVAPLRINDVQWHEGTDRDSDFKRTYPRVYYDHAVQHVVTEVKSYQSFKKAAYLQSLRLKMYSLKSRIAMKLSKTAAD